MGAWALPHSGHSAARSVGRISKKQMDELMAGGEGATMDVSAARVNLFAHALFEGGPKINSVRVHCECVMNSTIGHTCIVVDPIG
jgi:hypothetical protein